MAFSKRFPRDVKGSAYPLWEEIKLTAEEEKATEEKARQENNRVMRECIDDAKAIAAERGLKPFETSVVHIAAALFDKRASHAIYRKEAKAKEKFDSGSG